jgi:hypothetical protein
VAQPELVEPEVLVAPVEPVAPAAIQDRLVQWAPDRMARHPALSYPVALAILVVLV